jgi:hypothetical protein
MWATETWCQLQAQFYVTVNYLHVRHQSTIRNPNLRGQEGSVSNFGTWYHTKPEHQRSTEAGRIHHAFPGHQHNQKWQLWEDREYQRINIGDAHPICLPPTLLLSRQAKANETLKNMEVEGMIKGDSLWSFWSSPIMAVQKMEGDHCFYMDYRKLKDVTEVFFS